MFRSNMNPSKLEWATLPLNARSGVRFGQIVLLTSESLNFPCGCSGRDSQDLLPSADRKLNARTELGQHLGLWAPDAAGDVPSDCSAGRELLQSSDGHAFVSTPDFA